MYLFHDKGHLFLHVLGRVLCLSWHLSDNTLVTGASDSTVRLYNVTSGMHLLMLPITKLFIWVTSSEDCSDNMDRFDGCLISLSVPNFIGHCTLRITVDEFQSRSTLIWAIHMTRYSLHHCTNQQPTKRNDTLESLFYHGFAIGLDRLWITILRHYIWFIIVQRLFNETVSL